MSLIFIALLHYENILTTKFSQIAVSSHVTVITARTTIWFMQCAHTHTPWEIQYHDTD